MDNYFHSANEETFQSHWVFVGLKTLIPNKNDYVLRTIAGKSVIIRNDGDAIYALENRCPHRGAKFFIEEQGNGFLKCPFHGWGFRGDGALAGIPHKEKLYGFTDEFCSEIKIHNYSVELVGQFIFINLSDSPQPLYGQFRDEIIEVLEKISLNADSSYSKTKINAKCNWKLLVEITMDELHLPFVHPQTINIIRPYTPPDKAYEDAELIHGPQHFKSLKSLSFLVTNSIEEKDEVWHKNVDKIDLEKKYYDIYAFPNLHLVVPDGGYSFSYEAYYPNTFDETLIEYYFSTAKTHNRSLIYKAVHLASMKIGIEVFMEDIAMMENLQANSHNSKFPNHGNYEKIRLKPWREFFYKKCNWNFNE